jgi:hypothetical protein
MLTLAACRVGRGFVVGSSSGSVLEQLKRVLEHDLAIGLGGLDLAQSRLGLAVPAPRPAVGVHDALAGRIGTDDSAGEVAGAAQILERRLAAGGFGQAPV